MSQLEAKDPAETITLTFPYADELGTATISTAACAIAVQTGTDAAVGSMLQGSASVSGSNVLQQVKLGVNAVDYMVRCLATCSDGRVLLRAATLPVRTGG